MKFAKFFTLALLSFTVFSFADKDETIAGVKDNASCELAKSKLDDTRKKCNEIRREDGSSSFKYKLCLKKQDSDKKDAQEACSKKNTKELKKERKEADKKAKEAEKEAKADSSSAKE